MAFKHGTPNSIVTDGLVFCVDAANKVSWTGPNSSTVNNLVSTNTGSIVNDTSGSYGDNNSFAFDGTDDYIDCGSNNIVTGIFSISVWMKRSLSGGDSSPFLVGKDDVSSNRTFACYLNKGGGYFQFFISNTGAFISSKRITTTDTITDENWHNLVFINGGSSGQMQIYIDGQLAQINSSPRSGLDTLHGSTTSTRIGDSDTNSHSFSGNISNVFFYNKALSTSEILQNYNALKNRFRT